MHTVLVCMGDKVDGRKEFLNKNANFNKVDGFIEKVRFKQDKRLSHSYHRIVNGAVAVRVVFTHTVAHYTRGLFMRFIKTPPPPRTS